ncbi:MAG: hypothetical protein WDM91_14310 [Rhizomicrobium sp.]
MDEAQKSDRAGERVWWGGIAWRARAALAVFGLAALALILPPQVQDMLANLADSVDMSTEAWLHALGFHFAMILMAVGLWYWARAVLLAWFRIPDNQQSRAAFKSLLGTATANAGLAAERANACRAFDFLPRALAVGTALAAALATIRSDKYLQAAIALVWGAALYWLLEHRLAIQARLGIHEAAAIPPRPPGRWWLARLWQRLKELLDYAPLGRWMAAWSLAFASALFVLSFLTAFVPHSILWKTYLAHLLPGPSVFLFLLGLSVAPLTVLTYVVDNATRSISWWGTPRRLRYAPVLTLLLVLMGIGAQILNLHALRLVDEPNAMTPEQRQPLSVLFKAWVAKCAPGDGPVQPVIVAVSGGASRASLWAARVLDVVDDSVRRSGSKSASIFAVSSVSGGSLGTAAYLAMRAGLSEKGTACALPPVPNETRDIATIEAMRADAIGPALAGTMLGDAPRALAAYFAWPVVKVQALLRAESDHSDQIRLLRANDRAEALERAFEYNWQVNGVDSIKAVQAPPLGLERPYLSLFYGPGATPRGDVPLWISNGTDVSTGDRLLTLPFAVNAERFCTGDGKWYAPDDIPQPGCGKPHAAYFWQARGPFLAARDVLTLMRADVPISTAIDNTSRFPFLSPSGELTPLWNPKPPGVKKPDDAQIIDGGYFENDGIMSAMELAAWLKAYGPSLIGRPVWPIVVEAIADADPGKEERDIPRCGNLLPLNPGVANAQPRDSQFLVPLIGLAAVRSGHSRALLQQALEDFCGEGGQQAFFDFYLYSAPDFTIPLNWSLSERVADFIWDGSMATCGNVAERRNLVATLTLPGTAWKTGGDLGGRSLYACRGDPLKVTTVTLPKLPPAGGGP